MLRDLASCCIAYGQYLLSLHGDTAGPPAQGRISRYPFGGLGDRGLMVRDYLELQVGLLGVVVTFPFISFFIFVATLQISCPTYTCADRFQPPGLLTAFNPQLPFCDVLSIEEKSLLLE